VGFNVAGYELGLQPEGTAPVPVHNVMTYWRVADVAVAMEALIAQGAAVLDAAQDVGEGIVCGAVRDPWGNAIGLICNPHFKI
jgi:predicted enzyme related to lactoylglutathione lyase